LVKTRMKNKKTVCYILCYKDPNYIRTLTLLKALSEIKSINLVVVKNKERGFLRYFEVFLKLVQLRIKTRPDIFLVGFRAQESFWMFYPLMFGSKIIFDEFINLHDWLVDEHHKLNDGTILVRLIDRYMKWVIKSSDIILEDTQGHADLSAKIYGTPQEKMKIIPVGADESIFYPRQTKTHKKFEILFYGSMLPLHGVNIIVQAIELLAKDNKVKSMHFTLIGGNDKFETEIQLFQKQNNLSENLTYIKWVDFNKLPDLIAKADLGLGGPFGNTSQAARVITGKTFQFLAMGKPVIIGKNDVTGDFEDKRNCLTTDREDPDKLAESLSWAENNRVKLKRIGAEGKMLYEKYYSNKVIVKEVGGIINELR